MTQSEPPPSSRTPRQPDSAPPASADDNRQRNSRPRQRGALSEVSDAYALLAQSAMMQHRAYLKLAGLDPDQPHDKDATVEFSQLDRAKAARALGEPMPRASAPMPDAPIAATPRLLTRKQAARYLGINPKTFDKHVRPHVQPDANLNRYSKELLDQWQRRKQNDGQAESQSGDPGAFGCGATGSRSVSRTRGTATSTARGRRILKLLSE